MAIKMRVLYASSKKKVADMAAMIHSEFQLPVNAIDKIPTAYSCDKERLVVLMLSVKGEPSDQLRLFCSELTKARAQNVALVIDGNEDGAKKVKAILAEAGTNVKDEVFYVKSSFLPFLNSVKDDEKAAALAWAHRIVDSL